LHFQGSERESVPGWVGYLQHSSLNYFYSSGQFTLGRGNPYFFNMNESLLLNPYFPPAEYIWWQHGIQWFQFDWGITFLNSMQSSNRFLTFHRYGIQNKNWRIGFTEAVLVNYESLGSKEIGYLMPANVMLETEVNRGTNANLMWLFDGMYKKDNWTIYAEILIDDYAIDGKSPHQIATVIGLGKDLNNILLNIGYTRINRWVGNHCNTLNIWIDEEVPIGHQVGSDAHKFQLDSYYIINKQFSVEILAGWVEHGYGGAYDRLTESWPTGIECDHNFGYTKEKFPSQSNSNVYSRLTMYYLYREWLMMNVYIDNNNDTKIIFTMTLKI